MMSELLMGETVSSINGMFAQRKFPDLNAKAVSYKLLKTFLLMLGAFIAIASLGAQTIRAAGCGGASFSQPPGSPIATGNVPQTLATADLNLDGKLDLIVGNGNDQNFRVLLGNGSGGFTLSYTSPAVGAVEVFAVGDFNLDGKPDIAVSAGLSSVDIFFGNGNGTFTINSNFPDVGTKPFGLATADFNLDGKPDIVVTNIIPAGTVRILLGDGKGGFTLSGSPIPVGSSPVGVMVADLNADGKADLAVTNAGSNNVSILIGTGAGGFTQAAGSPFSVANSPRIVIAADFNSDNKPDLAITNVNSNNVTILLGNGAGGFTEAAGSPVNAGSFSWGLAAADFDLDGKLDLAVSNSGADNVSILLGNGNGGFNEAPGSPVITGGHPYSVVAGDFNQDGRPDFAAPSEFLNAVTIELNTCGVAPGVLQISQPNYSVPEDLGAVTITVTRSGETGGASTVDYATVDGTATQKSDFEFTAGTIKFLPGETTKTFQILINEDMYTEGTETFKVALSSPSGATLGSVASSTISITDDVPEWTTSPIDDPQSYVYMHYHDLLNREPDASGLAFWTSQFASCGGNQQCIDGQRVNVSAAFFLSIEFQTTGFLVYRTYKAAYGNIPGAPVPVRLGEFLPDTGEIGRGVVVGQGTWKQTLESNIVTFMNDFIRRPRFTTAYPTTMTAPQFVDALFANAGIVPSANTRQGVIADFNGSPSSNDLTARAQALRDVAEDSGLGQQEFSRAFVLMQYFGYLRRDPNAAPEPGLNYDGYNFWLNKLNQFGGNYINAEMVKAFITSIEYRQRFGPN